MFNKQNCPGFGTPQLKELNDIFGDHLAELQKEEKIDNTRVIRLQVTEEKAQIMADILTKYTRFEWNLCSQGDKYDIYTY